MADRELLLSLLLNLETEMREMDLWESQSPPAEAFESQLPFFYDTMNFSQWLQWVFVARFRAILEGPHPLPPSCEVAPMAEEYFAELEVYSDPVVGLLRRFDEEFK
ncbi:MAG: YqcC family protein [Pseudomonadota bacterium]|nr:YqcC family protein [Pseudomonadota bacterium]